MGPNYEANKDTKGYPIYEPIGHIDQAPRKRISG